MSPAEKEVELLDAAYQLAIRKLGVRMVTELLADWQAVSALNGASVRKFTKSTTAMIYLYRAMARKLSVRHTQLVRALILGATYRDPEFTDDDVSAIGALRQSFYDELDALDVPRPRRAKAIGPDVEVDVEEFTGLDELASRRKTLADRQIDGLFKVLLDDNLEARKGDLRDDDPRWDEKMRKLELDVGARVISAAERLGLNGARENDADIISIDRRAVGWIRQHDPGKTDHPCGFCSMLMTRGFLTGGIYSSEQAALYDQNGDKYHANCHCVAIKVYSKSQLQSPRFEKHRSLAKEYREVVGKASGPDALKAWDKYIRDKYPSDSKSHEDTATQADAA